MESSVDHESSLLRDSEMKLVSITMYSLYVFVVIY